MRASTPLLMPAQGSSPAPPTTPLVDAELVNMLYISIQDEYRARYTYLAVLVDYPNRAPFASIAEAEAQHIDEVARLFTNRGLEVPASLFSVGNVPRYSTFAAACEAGVLAETANYLMYEGFLANLREAGPVPQDVEDVFNSLMVCSRDEHLPAFLTCAR